MDARRKRVLWSISEIISTVYLATEKHNSYLGMKRNRQASQFWMEIGTVVGKSGEETERLMKNLSSEYQKVRQLLHISGIDTDDDRLELRKSKGLYVAFDEYYAVFYPHGGSVKPAMIITENSHSDLRNLVPSIEVAAEEDANIEDATSEEGSVIEKDLAERVMDKRSGKVVGNKRKLHEKDMSSGSVKVSKTEVGSDSFLEQTLEISRQNLKEQQNQTRAIERLVDEISWFRQAYMAVNNVVINLNDDVLKSEP